jgi:membrane protein involved in colicin uptake
MNEQEAKAKAEQEAKAKAEQEAKAKAEQEAKAKAEAKKNPSPEQKKKDRLNSLREQAIALRDQGVLAPAAVVEYFSAGIDSNFEEIEAKLKAFAESVENG